MTDSLPKDMHPMTQFTIGLAACQTESEFAKAYQDGAQDGVQVRPRGYFECRR
jgi:citrate synthase